jgi:hypothetical protein
MKKSDMFRTLAEILTLDQKLRADKYADRTRRRELAEQSRQRMMSAIIPLLPALLERLIPAGNPHEACPDLGIDLASAVSALNQSLTPDQLATIGQVLTAEQQFMMTDATRLASNILGEISPEDMADIVAKANSRPGSDSNHQDQDAPT